MSRILALLLTSVALAAQAEETPKVEKCDRELGTLAVAEPQDHMLASLSRYSLGSPSVMLRMMAQESGCFAVVERGVAMQNIRQERELAADGMSQAGSNMGGGQLQAADFVMTPSVQFSGDTGGIGGHVGGLLNKVPGLGNLASIAGGVKFREAETTLLVADVRSGLQVASGEGKASKMNFSLRGWGWGGLGWASASGYTKTPEGKLIAASLLDNYNKVVLQIRAKPSLIRTHAQSSQQNAANSLAATGSHAAAQQPAVQPSNAAAGIGGAFTGQLQGSESGVLSLIVGADGRVSGVGQSPSLGAFSLSGVVNAGGALVMSAPVRGGELQISAVIDARSGQLVGTWQAPRAQGTLNAKRAS
jgi:curli biogenesis system outer membrane secretion channel CsgG